MYSFDIIINKNYRRPNSRDLSERVLNPRIVLETRNLKSAFGDHLSEFSVLTVPRSMCTCFLSKKCSEVEDNLVKWHTH